MAATLVIGLGGTGCNIVREVARRAYEQKINDVEFLVMDTDVNMLNEVERENPMVRIIQTSPRGTVGAALDRNHFAKDRWFPLNEGLMGKSFSEGAGQVRAISRLALDFTIRQGGMRPLEEAIEHLRGLSGDTLHQEMRIMICGSLAGGTGSGILLPVGMYVRNYLQTHYQDYSTIIRGLFLEPDTFFDVITDEEERNSLRANAYAAIRELDAFFRKKHQGQMGGYKGVVFNAPQPGVGERMDYPNVLPYDFIFLLDAINEEGEHLPTKLDYESHAADILYTVALSPASGPSNSKEDNAIKKLVETNGRAHYCGAGVSRLEYPAHMVQRYVALRWALECMTDQWTYFERMYRLEQAEGLVHRSMREYYINTFRQHRDNKDFAYVVRAAEGTQRIIKTGETEHIEEYAGYFTNQVLQHAATWNERRLNASSPEIAQASSSTMFMGLPADSDAIKTDSEASADSLAAEYSSKYAKYYTNLRAYANAVREGAASAARAAFRLEYKTPEYEDPFKVHRDKWHFESIASKEGGKSAVHPAGVRYLLYTCIKEHDRLIATMEKSIASLEEQINEIIGDGVDFNVRADGVQTVDQSVAQVISEGEQDVQKSGIAKVVGLFATLLGHKQTLDDTAINSLLNIKGDLEETKERIDELRKMTVEYEALQADRAHLEELASAYEAFFAMLRDKINAIDTEVESIERDPRYNSHRGKTCRYVLADSFSLKHVYEDCRRLGDDGELSGELSADLFRELLAISSRRGFNLPSDALESWMRRKYSEAFENVVMSHWMKCVASPTNPNASIVDLDVVKALVREATYVNQGSATTQQELEEANKAYIERVFVALRHLATPFIEKPTSSWVRDVAVCAYNESVLNNSGAYRDLLRELLVESGGFESDACSDQSITFYRSVYGFCATDLPKYAPRHGESEPHPAGEYHNVYWRIVNQLSPNLASNIAVTPHIDRNWHLVTFLPDLSEEHEQQIVDNTCKAFLYGLLWNEFSDHGSEESGPVFVLSRGNQVRGRRRRGRSKSAETELLVTNQTLCDHFYEVYDALTYNPRLVDELLRRFEDKLMEEVRQAASPSVKRCELVTKKLRSEAFVEEKLDTLLQRLCKRAEVRIGIARVGDNAGKRDIKDLTHELVCNLFGTDYKEDALDGYLDERWSDDYRGDQSGMYGDASYLKKPMRISIFTIPLLYRISLSYGVSRDLEISNMIDCVFTFVRSYLACFCDEHDLDNLCDRLLAEQYLVFEENVAWLEVYVAGIHGNKTVSEVREVVKSYFDASTDIKGSLVGGKMEEIISAWK